jgi:lysophospholipase L1-like esterase
MTMNADSKPPIATPTPSSSKRKLPLLKKLAFALIATTFFFVMLELLLRLIGFRFFPGAPDVVVNGEAVAPMFRHSKSIRWEPIPGAPPFNQDGFVGPRIARERTARALRVATLGDSCTQFGEPTYSDLLRERLAGRTGKQVEVLNAGVGGYSTEQGLTRLQKVLPYRPDYVSIYFGWNDHWRLEKVTDAQRAEEDARNWAWLDYTSWSRIVQLGLYGAHTIHERRGWRLAQQPYVMRVPLDRFRRNLVEMAASVREISAEPILVTPPTDMGPETPIEAFDALKTLAGTGYDSPKEIHDAYVDAIRQVARDSHIRLVDATAAFEGQFGLMTRDHIHLTPDGIELMSRLLADEILAERGSNED